MKSLVILFILMTCLSTGTWAEKDSVPRVIDEDGPARGLETLALQELWRIGGEDEDVIFGRIVDVERHPNGEVYILDNQLCQVVVVSAEGEHLRNLSRQGDGPGELRQPTGMVVLEEDLVGVGLGFPGKMVTLRRDGTPVDSRYPIGEPKEGNIGVMIGIQGVDGVLVANGGRLVFAGDGESYSKRFLSVSAFAVESSHRILERNTPLDPTGRTFVESETYYLDGNWALGPEGRIYAPLERDAYEISVLDRTGELLGVFGRQVTPRKRTQDEKDEVGPVINAAGGADRSGWKIADHDQAVLRLLFNHEENSVWVLTPQGSNDQPAGILETWDVFGTDGEFLRQVAVPLANEMDEGACYLVGGGLLVVVKGTASSFDGRQGADEEAAEDEVEPLEVICYRMN